MAGFPPTSLGYSKLSTYLLRRAAWCVALLFVSLPGGRLCGADPLVQFNLLELATSRQAQASLQSEASFFFEQRPLREGLQEIAEVHGLSLWIDRRIDPTRPLTFNASPRDERTELAARLQQVSALADAEFGLIESVIYVGPRGQAERLQRAAVVLHDAISRLQPGNQVQQRDWQWPELSTPNTILKKLEADWQISLAAELPHDLLHAGQLRQPTTLATQLTLLFGGFAQAVQATAAGRFQAAPLAAEGGWQASYRKADLDLKDWRALQHRFPGSEVRVRGTLAQLRGPTAFHLALMKPLRGAPPAANAKLQRWGFNVEQVPAEAVIDKLASSLGWEVTWDPRCTPEQRQQRVSFRVEQATLAELLDAFAQAAALQVQLQGHKLNIQP